mgnify:CR=1 FL=1
MAEEKICMLRAEDIKKSFGSNHILKGVNLEVDKGDVVVILGPSGAGKTTFLRCLNFLEKPNSGKITIDDLTVDAHNVNKKDIVKLRRKTAILPAVDAGKVQIACSNLRRTEDREANYIHSKEAYITSPYYIIVLEGNSDINGIDDLNGKKLGINEGSTQAGILEQYIEKSGADIELVYSSDPVPDLVAGRIDAIVDPQRYVLSLNSSYEDAQFKTVGEPIDNLAEEGSVVADYNAYLWFSSEDTELRDAVDTALAELYADGTLGEISKEYYGEDYAKDINRDYVESFK